MSTEILRPAVFLDRDGTLNVEKDYLIDPVEFEFIPGAPQALKELQDAGYLLVVVTNQSGVARGLFSLEEVVRLNQYMERQLADYGVRLAGIYCCPHHPTAGEGEYRQVCSCRKGAPGLLLQAAAELSIELARSYMIGDKEADILAGKSAGCKKSFLVKTGYGATSLESARLLGADMVADLPAAAQKILVERCR